MNLNFIFEFFVKRNQCILFSCSPNGSLQLFSLKSTFWELEFLYAICKSYSWAKFIDFSMLNTYSTIKNACSKFNPNRRLSSTICIYWTHSGWNSWKFQIWIPIDRTLYQAALWSEFCLEYQGSLNFLPRYAYGTKKKF